MLAVLYLLMDNSSAACPLSHQEGPVPLQLGVVSPGGVHCAMLLKHMLRINNDFTSQQEMAIGPVQVAVTTA